MDNEMKNEAGMEEVKTEDLEKAAGGYTLNEAIQVYVSLCMKVHNATYRYNYKKPHCPKCGKELPIPSRIHADERCCETAFETGNLMCSFCHATSNPEEWVTTPRNLV